MSSSSAVGAGPSFFSSHKWALGSRLDTTAFANDSGKSRLHPSVLEVLDLPPSPQSRRLSHVAAVAITPCRDLLHHRDCLRPLARVVSFVLSGNKISSSMHTCVASVAACGTIMASDSEIFKTAAARAKDAASTME